MTKINKLKLQLLDIETININSKSQLDTKDKLMIHCESMFKNTIIPETYINLILANLDLIIYEESSFEEELLIYKIYSEYILLFEKKYILFEEKALNKDLLLLNLTKKVNLLLK